MTTLLIPTGEIHLGCSFLYLAILVKDFQKFWNFSRRLLLIGSWFTSMQTPKKKKKIQSSQWTDGLPCVIGELHSLEAHNYKFNLEQRLLTSGAEWPQFLSTTSSNSEEWERNEEAIKGAALVSIVTEPYLCPNRCETPELHDINLP